MQVAEILRKYKKLFAIAVCAMFVWTSGVTVVAGLQMARAETYSPANWFTFTSGKITGLTATGQGQTVISIPSSIDGVPVVEIGSDAFSGRTGITSITIPNSVTTIGHEAFIGCTGLTSITIPDSVESISTNAFRDCTGVKSITIGTGVELVVFSTFAGLRNVEKLTWNAKDCLIVNSSAWLYLFPPVFDELGIDGPGVKVTFGSMVEVIPFNMFNNSAKIVGEINIPDSVIKIGFGAFRYQEGITNVTIGKSVETIEEGAFEGCTNLATITLKGTNTALEDINAIPDETIQIFVPFGRGDAYRATTNWSHPSISLRIVELPCDCGVCEECDPPVTEPPPDLSDVGMKEEDGKVILTNIDEDTIDEHKITFRWWRKVGNGEWELIDVPPNQPWVDLELHPDEDVIYKCDIIVRDEFQLARERSFVPPIPRTNILQNPFLWGLAGIFAIWGIVFIIIAVNRREEKRKKLAALKK